MTKKPTTVRFSDEEETVLEMIAKQTGLNVAEIIRRSVRLLHREIGAQSPAVLLDLTPERLAAALHAHAPTLIVEPPVSGASSASAAGGRLTAAEVVKKAEERARRLQQESQPGSAATAPGKGRASAPPSKRKPRA